MKRLAPASILVAVAIVSSACATRFSGNAIANTELQSVDFSKLQSMKKGEACSTTVLGLFTDGSAHVSDAARIGGISRVVHVEYRASANPIFSKQCTIVYGQ